MLISGDSFVIILASSPPQDGLLQELLSSAKSNRNVLSVLKRCVPKTLAFAFGLRLRSKTRCFKTRVLGRRLPNGKPQERLRFRDLRSKTLAFKKRNAIAFCDLKTSLGARACVQVACVQKTRRFAFAFLSPLSFRGISEHLSQVVGRTLWDAPVPFCTRPFLGGRFGFFWLTTHHLGPYPL